ncbi:AAA family ATPase [Rhodococcus tukisamuensis]|uniref:TniB protein n=1 Tax=Rhodococcus tukisamuensis TaxID=168276 RepID=A0A1G7DHI9_9NOCA|nr:AAA family ATPase [Rhodococcus tukisamuensis]SDE50516.1 TniB protein [Rhodococcus tukisamuensis]
MMSYAADSAPAVLQNRADWPRLYRRAPIDRPPCGLDGDPTQLQRWIDRLTPLETPDIARIEAAMLEVIAVNTDRGGGARRWLGIDGPPMAGKTHATATAMLRVHDHLLKSPPPPIARGVRAEHIPVVYVSDQGASWSRLMRSIAGFVGLPQSKSETGPDILTRLREVLPLLGTRLIVVDDAHMLRRVGAARDLTDSLKLTLDALPVSFVYVGAGLHDSALLRRTDSAGGGYSAAQQMAGRMNRCALNSFDPTVDADINRWHRRLHPLIKRLEQIKGFDSTELRSSEFSHRLFHIADGLTGASIDLLKDCSKKAIGKKRSPQISDLDGLEALAIEGAHP